jgi:hypothetical protein
VLVIKERLRFEKGDLVIKNESVLSIINL